MILFNTRGLNHKIQHRCTEGLCKNPHADAFVFADVSNGKKYGEIGSKTEPPAVCESGIEVAGVPLGKDVICFGFVSKKETPLVKEKHARTRVAIEEPTVQPTKLLDGVSSSGGGDKAESWK